MLAVDFADFKAKVLRRCRRAGGGAVEGLAMEWSFALGSSVVVEFTRLTKTGDPAKLLVVYARPLVARLSPAMLGAELRRLWLDRVWLDPIEAHSIEERPDAITLEFITLASDDGPFVTGIVIVDLRPRKVKGRGAARPIQAPPMASAQVRDGAGRGGVAQALGEVAMVPVRSFRARFFLLRPEEGGRRIPIGTGYRAQCRFSDGQRWDNDVTVAIVGHDAHSAVEPTPVVNLLGARIPLERWYDYQRRLRAWEAGQGPPPGETTDEQRQLTEVARPYLCFPGAECAAWLEFLAPELVPVPVEVGRAFILREGTVVVARGVVTALTHERFRHLL